MAAFDDIEHLLPLTEPALHLLLALADAEMHGWAILKQVERATQGRVRLSAGTLYGLIKRLEESGLIEESNERPPPHWDDARRRYYRLTDLGSRALRAELDRLKALVDLGRRLDLEPVLP